MNGAMPSRDQPPAMLPRVDGQPAPGARRPQTTSERWEVLGLIVPPHIAEALRSRSSECTHTCPCTSDMECTHDCPCQEAPQ